MDAPIIRQAACREGEVVSWDPEADARAREFNRLWDESAVQVQKEHAQRFVDLWAVIEYADQRATAVAEKDGAVEVYGLRAADWNRIVAVARGHKSKAAQRVIDSVIFPPTVIAQAVGEKVRLAEKGK